MIQRGKDNENLCKYAYYHGFVIGSICSRIEPILISADGSPSHIVSSAEPVSQPAVESCKTMKKRIYIMTLGVLAAYRGYGVGQQLVQSILDYYEQGRTRSFNGHDIQELAHVEEIVLHVHTSNEEAIRFYVEKFDFVRGDLIKNYYTQRIDPPDCYVLYKKL